MYSREKKKLNEKKQHENAFDLSNMLRVNSSSAAAELSKGENDDDGGGVEDLRDRNQ